MKTMTEIKKARECCKGDMAYCQCQLCPYFESDMCVDELEADSQAALDILLSRVVDVERDSRVKYALDAINVALGDIYVALDLIVASDEYKDRVTNVVDAVAYLHRAVDALIQ